MRKLMLFGACLLLAALPLTACGDGGSSSEATVVGQAKAELSQAECNNTARRMLAAANAVLTDLASSGEDISSLDGAKTAASNAFLSAASGASGLEERLYAGMKVYDTDLEKSDFKQLGLQIKSGVCTAAALRFGEGEQLVYGTYPNAAAEDTFSGSVSMQDLLNYAES